MSERLHRIEALLEEADAATIELVTELLDLYGEGLERVMATVDEEQAARLAADELVGSLLLLHDLHPLDRDARLQAVLAGGSAELLAVEEGRVRLRMRPAGCGTAAAAAALRRAVLDAVPEVDEVEVEVGDATLIPVESLTVRRAAAP
ncbi:hypothetical protein SAMN05421874_106286 [Nonomuraea maritima]|uniref:NifU-like domain-containing protein n=1 Tax=Nonomuraea maritima TaxID=683260 RepID=A0A1G9AP55_9ACTN|nr:hypothetical protein [Nonomuraea maritima]SDK29088.1 hypothetical protein SAMN05421874_106286 [Nonomuraea maritima]